jgi:predicted glutamine amidotransferase
VIVTAPLTKNETWTPFEKGRIHLFEHGRLVALQ